MNSVNFKDVEDKERWRRFITELYNKYYSDDSEDTNNNYTTKEKRVRQKERNKQKIQEKRKKKAQIAANKAKHEEEINERKAKIKTLITIEDNPIDTPKRRGRPPKEKVEEPIKKKQKTLF